LLEVTRRIQTHVQKDWAAADRTVFDVVLVSSGLVHADFERLAAVRASDLGDV
jgi:riboflavin biosynthesis pyrimidine reductase